MQLHELITTLRVAKGWTRYKLAKEAGISWDVLRNIEEQINSPSVKTLPAIFHALDVDVIIRKDGSFEAVK